MKVTFNGSVSTQHAPGETVTIKVTQPDSTIDTLTALTDDTGAFTISKNYLAGDYSARAHIDEDVLNKAKDSDVVSFTVPKQDRTLTLNVVVG